MRYQGIARASWVSIIVALVTSVLLQAAPWHPKTRAAILATGGLYALFPLIGVLSGIIALTRVPRYGRKGILLPAIVGVSIWALLFIIALPAFIIAKNHGLFTPPAVLTAVQHIPNSKPLNDPDLAFSMDIPPDFERMAPSPANATYAHSYIKITPGESNRVILVKSLNGPLPRHRITAADLPPGHQVTITSFSWRGLQLNGYRVLENPDTSPYLTFNIQVPLKAKAVQLSIGGPATAEPEIHETAVHVLNSVAGETNW
jgi:hypothetical protein